MDGEEVGGRVDLVGGLGAVDAELAVAVGGDVGVVGQDVHAEALRARRDELADAPEAEDPERLVHHLDAGELRALPLARCQARVRLRNVARQREQQRHRVLGGGDDVRLRRVGDDDPALGRRGNVDVVHADAGPADHLELLRPLDQLGGDLRRRADDQRVVLGDALGDVAVAADVDVEVALEQFDAAGPDVLRDEDLHASRSTSQSMHAVSACTSEGSIAGNMPMRSWLRPSLR